ncbi:MAG TPA: hypothetical protein VMV05_08910, partial [bacterium]|nr:hypothetical protein [bacterium]
VEQPTLRIVNQGGVTLFQQVMGDQDIPVKFTVQSGIYSLLKERNSTQLVVIVPVARGYSLNIYDYRQGQIKNIFSSVRSTLQYSIRDLDGDGNLEIFAQIYGDIPEVYSYFEEGGDYVDSSGSFPDAFKPFIQGNLEVIRKLAPRKAYSTIYSLREQLERIYRIQKNFTAANEETKRLSELKNFSPNGNDGGQPNLGSKVRVLPTPAKNP